MLSPKTFTAGETVSWSFSDADYRSDEYDLEVAFSSAGGAFKASGVANVTGGWDVTLAASATADVSAGTYGYQVAATKGEGDALERRVLERGTIELLPRLDGTQNIDPRSTDEIILDAITATLQGRATTDQASVSIDGTSISRLTLLELEEARDRFTARVGRRRRRSRQARCRF